MDQQADAVRDRRRDWGAVGIMVRYGTLVPTSVRRTRGAIRLHELVEAIDGEHTPEVVASAGLDAGIF